LIQFSGNLRYINKNSNNKFMNNKSIYTVLGILILAIIVVIAVRSGNDNGSINQPGNNTDAVSNETPSNSNNAVNFSKEGVLIKNNPGLKPNVWYLSYEEQGKPALVAELAFNAQQESGFKVGDKVSISGTLSNNIVSVTNITAVKTEDEKQYRTVKLYYYDQKKDLSENKNNASCESKYVLPVERKIEVTQTPIQDTIRLLIKGELTSAEKNAGFATEFPHKDFVLKGANLKDGTLTLDFPQVTGFTEGGSCRVNLLNAQIEKTAKQFPEVKQVKYTEILFQP
jgi:hypothetical protein